MTKKITLTYTSDAEQDYYNGALTRRFLISKKDACLLCRQRLVYVGNEVGKSTKPTSLPYYLPYRLSIKAGNTGAYMYAILYYVAGQYYIRAFSYVNEKFLMHNKIEKNKYWIEV